ncbi:SLC13 family permease [Tropicimonas sp. IMCC34043]|uniref:SLC13 family permease n=1 Tax=Tropicimonas sp. IMCC34043 TaxID=2248760 RepID=UPI000E24DE20|nr:SLC13 family permease [Tropicimonas sp. IMCC34043]
MPSKAGIEGKQLFVAGLVLVALWLSILPPAALSPHQAQTLGIVLVTLSLWGTGLVPGYLASLIFFAVTIIAGLAPPELVFSGFASAAIWLIISGFVIGSAISVSGLGERLASLVGPMLTGSYPRLIGGLMLTCMALGFLMPSSLGRAVVMVPIGMALAERCGFGTGSNGRIGVAAVLAVGCNMPSFAILPSNIPNVILSGSAETILGVHFTYADYLLLHYPVLGVLKSLATVLLVLRLFPATVEAAEIASHKDHDGTPGAGFNRGVQIRVMAILLVTLALWMTDGWHGINPAWIGLAASAILLMPGIGVVTPPAFKASVDFGTLLFVAGALALGAIVNASGLGAMIGQLLQDVLPLEAGRDAVNFASLVVMSTLTGLIATVPGVPAVLTPMAPDLANVTGFSVPAVLMTQVIGFSTVLFPYQVGPLVVAMQLSGERLGTLLRITLPLAAISLIVLVPINYLWWRLLGWI